MCLNEAERKYITVMVTIVCIINLLGFLFATYGMVDFN